MTLCSKHTGLLLALLLIVLLPYDGRAQEMKVLDEIVAVVGEEIILRSDVDAFVVGLLRQQQDLEYSKDLWNQALNQLINEKVLTIHAKRDTTIQVTDDQVEQALEQRIQQMTTQLGGPNRLEEIYGKSLVEIKADLREEFRDQLLADQFRSRKLRQIKITPSEVKAWFNRFPTDSLPTFPETVRLSHIVRFPAITEEARREAMEVITAIRDSIVTGRVSFEEYARLFSDDPGSAQNGGRYENMRLGEVVPEFAAVAARIPIGEISQVFETQFGLHILRVNRRLGDVIDYNHILIAFDESKADPSEAIAYLNAVRDSILTHGMPFELMARRHSEEQSSALRGGRVIDPRTGERDLVLAALGPRWQATLSGLQEGQISEPAEVELLNGRRAYHIVRLERRVPEHRVNLETDYALIEQYALREKQNRELAAWLDKLRESVYIDIRGAASESLVARRN
ncbi:MAG: peptidylprolyl isomerase [Rhodothermaceae bacterium]|nr:MAG: peptidylprolyl isomerase [Rhodothermaceae bacterium]